MTCKVLTIHENIVQWVEQITFLGMTICRAKAFKCNWDSVKARILSLIKCHNRKTRYLCTSQRHT